jgi:hypothetical protein
MARRVDATVCRWGEQEEGDREKKARKRFPRPNGQQYAKWYAVDALSREGAKKEIRVTLMVKLNV